MTLRDVLAQAVASTPPAELPDLIGDLERARALAFARLVTAPVPPVTRDELVDAAEMARRCGLTEFGVRDRARRGVLPCVRTGRRQVRFDPAAVLEALRLHRMVDPDRTEKRSAGKGTVHPVSTPSGLSIRAPRRLKAAAP